MLHSHSPGDKLTFFRTVQCPGVRVDVYFSFLKRSLVWSISFLLFCRTAGIGLCKHLAPPNIKCQCAAVGHLVILVTGLAHESKLRVLLCSPRVLCSLSKPKPSFLYKLMLFRLRSRSCRFFWLVWRRTKGALRDPARGERQLWCQNAVWQDLRPVGVIVVYNL